MTSSPSAALRPARRRTALPVFLLVAVTGPLVALPLLPAVSSTPPAEATAPDDVRASLVARTEPVPASRSRTAPRAARPSDGVLTSGFGTRWGRAHAGLDFASGVGAPVRAAAAGTVATVASENGYGITVRVHHPDGAETVYAHLSTTEVQPGQRVAVGQQLAREGSTGRSTGPHLHFEVRYAGTPVDPAAWLRERAVEV